MNADRGWKGISRLVLEDANVEVVDGLAYIPYYADSGDLANYRVVAPNGRRWWFQRGREVIPYGVDLLPIDPRAAARSALLVAEGESDALALREAFAGTTSDCPIRAYYVLGLPGARTWKPSWRRYLDPFALVYVIGDGDAAGREMVEKVYANAPWSRPVWLPEGADARSILQTEGPRALDPLLDQADATARLCVAFCAARSYEEFIGLLRGDERRARAAA